MRHSRPRGFTLIEVLAAAAILSVLGIWIARTVGQVMTSTGRSSRDSEVSEVRNAIRLLMGCANTMTAETSSCSGNVAIYRSGPPGVPLIIIPSGGNETKIGDVSLRATCQSPTAAYKKFDIQFKHMSDANWSPLFPGVPVACVDATVQSCDGSASGYAGIGSLPPQTISNAAQFAAIQDNRHYRLGANITVTTPVPLRRKIVLDGDGHTLTVNMNVPAATEAGAFANLECSHIKNLNVTNSTLTASSARTGFVAGAATYSRFENIRVSNSNLVGGTSGGIVGHSPTSILDGILIEGSNIAGGMVGGIIGYGGGVNSSRIRTTIVRGHANVGGAVGHCFSSFSVSGVTTESTVSFAHYGSGTGPTYVGGIVGFSQCEITNSQNAATITGEWPIGGIVGRTYRSVTGSSNTGTISGSGGGIAGLVANASGANILFENNWSSGNVTGGGGGLVGRFWKQFGGYQMRMRNCYATGNVGSGGGLIAEVDGGSGPEEISDCYATGNVGAGWSSGEAGGLIGNCRCPLLRRCYATGTVRGGKAGGLIGTLYGNVEDSYATGAVQSYTPSPSGFAAGLVASISVGTITRSYATGAVTGTASPVATLRGLVGQITMSGSATDSYWDTATTGQATSAAGLARTTAQLKDPSNYPAAWDTATVWQISSGQYPTLR